MDVLDTIAEGFSLDKKTSDKSPKEFFLDICKIFDKETNSRESKIRYEIIIQMCRKFRGATPSDLFGFWENGVWLDSPKFNKLHGTNVFQSLVRAAEAGYLQSRISLDIKALTNTIESKRIEEIARAIYEYLETEWTNLERQIFFASVLRLNAIAISYFDKTQGFDIPIPVYVESQSVSGGTAVCVTCGYNESYIDEIPSQCPECGGQMEPFSEPEVTELSVVSGFTSEKSGKPCTIITDALDVTVDDSYGVSSDISKSSWVQYRRLVHKTKLKYLYPHLELNEKPKWSYPTMLKMGFKRYVNGTYYPKEDFEKELYEVKQCWIEPSLYADYVSPVSEKIGNFTIKQGESLVEKFPEGIMFVVVGKEIAEITGENKNRRIKSCVWLSDPSSFYGLGVRAGLQIQKKINQLDNIAMEGEARSMKGSLIYSPHAIDGSKLEGANTNIPLRPEFSTNGVPLNHFIREIEVSGLSQQSLMFLSSQVDTMQRVMGIPDVLLGEGDSRVKTATGQQLVAQRAMGLFIPPKKSEAEMKRGWFRDQLDLIQKYMSPVSLKRYGTMWGESWTEEDLEIFFQVNLDDILNISITNDSEIPETRAEKQAKLRNDIAAGFIPLTPQIQMKLIQQSGYDSLDVGDFYSNDRLAQYRYSKLLSIAANEEILSQFEIANSAMESGQIPSVNEAGQKMANPLVETVLQDKVFRVMDETEQHQQHISFWSAKARKHAASDAPEAQFLVAACEEMVVKHKLAAFNVSARESSLAGLSQAPVEAGSAVTSAVGQAAAADLIPQAQMMPATNGGK